MSGSRIRFDGCFWPQGSLLAEIPTGDRDDLLCAGRRREFEADEILLFEGARSTHVLLLVDGCVKVTANTDEGKLALLSIRVGGDVVGELAGLDDQPRSATVTGAGPVRTQSISQQEFREFLVEHPKTSMAVSRSIGTELRWATRRRSDFGGCEVPVRLARVLLELARSYGHSTASGLVIDVSLTQPELAGLIGASDVTVHRALRELRAEGVVETGYRRNVIAAPAVLRKIAGFLPENP